MKLEDKQRGSARWTVSGALSPPLRQAYTRMRRRFGHQHWWPGDTPFEVCVGAILTQNTNWQNVERAIANLKSARVLEPAKLAALEHAELATLIRPAGYFNIKALRLRSFLRVLMVEFGGDLDRLFSGETARVRERLLAIHGIGPETADSLLLYAGGHASFVVDAYTKRIFHRHGWCGEMDVGKPTASGARAGDCAARYEELKAICEAVLGQKPAMEQLDYWQDYHAQLVMVGKHFCRPREPRCLDCPLRSLLPATHSRCANARCGGAAIKRAVNPIQRRDR